MKNKGSFVLVGLLFAVRAFAQPVFTNCPANTNLGCNPVTLPDCDANVRANDNCAQAGYLLVSSSANNTIKRYHALTGAFIDDFVPSFNNGGLYGPQGLTFGPDGNLYVCSFNNSKVIRYDGTSGAYIDDFVPNVSSPFGLVFGPDGNLYVTSYNASEVKRYDGTTGAFIDTFVPSFSNGGLYAAQGLAFGPDGNLYVCSQFTSEVKRYNGTTGAFMDNFATGNGLSSPFALSFGADGNLYVSSFGSAQVKRYDGTTGTFIDDFVPNNNNGGLSGPQGLAFGLDGNLFVSSYNTQTVLRYNGTSGVFIDTIQGGNPSNPTFLVFKHTPLPTAVTCARTDTNDGCTNSRTLTYTAVDLCNQTNTCTQVVTWTLDTTGPVFDWPSSKVVECGPSWSFDTPTATDSCSGTDVTIVVVDTVTNGSACYETITRTWSATDPCGNSNTCYQTVTVVDATPPVITCASDKTVVCDVAWAFDEPAVNDVCSGNNVTLTVLNNTTNEGCPRLITQIWRATDPCGNYSTCTQTVSLVSTSPCLPPPSGMTLWLPFDETSGTTSFNLAGGNNGTQINGPSVNPGSYVANSLCFNGSSTYVEVPSYDAINFGTGNFSIDAWVRRPANDPQSDVRVILDKRNESSAVTGYHLFLYNAGTIGFQLADGGYANWLSTLAVPNDSQWHHVAVTVNRASTSGIRFYLDGVVDAVPRNPVPYPGSVSTSSPLRVGSRSSSVSGVFNGCIDEVELFNRVLTPGEIAGLYNAGSAGKCKPPAPVLACASNKTVECGSDWSFDPPTAYDACSGANATITVLSTVTNSLCPTVIKRTWLATGACRTTATCSQTVTIQQPATVIMTCSSNKTAECGTVWTFDPPSAYDACSGSNAAITVLSTVTNGVCPQLITRTWLATDACGNSNSCTQTVTLVDTTPPVVTCVGDKTVQCGLIWSFDPPSALDACSSTNVDITVLSTTTNGVCPRVITRTWLATDACGNTNTCSQTVTLSLAGLCAAGETWTPRESLRDWYSVASSADGSKLVAVEYTGRIYTSTDSGVTWTPRASNGNWCCVASSADGSKLLVGTYGHQLYTSADSGATWTPQGSNQNWQSVASSADGNKLIAVVYGGPIYTSADSGATWTPRESNRNWSGVASSADGNNLVAMVSGGQIYTSTDSGTTWTPRESNRGWYSAASSADGSKLVAVVFGGQIYNSADSGTTWTPRESNRNWSGVASSADGSRLVAVGHAPDRIYTSTDSGVNWTPRESPRVWKSVASSADGSKLVAAAYFDRIYTSVCPGPPPVLTCVPDKTVQCGTAWTFDLPTATDACGGGNVTITTVTTVTNGQCPTIITRAWLATDCAGNTNSCSQTVTVADTTPPVLTCIGNKTVQCGSSWNFDPPTAYDACSGSSAAITELSTVTNGVCPQLITRTWLATDVCGNTNTCSQVVTIVDTTPPVFTNCPGTTNLGWNPVNIPDCDPNVRGTDSCGLAVPSYLLVSSYYTSDVKRYGGTTGAFVNTFASGGGLNGSHGLVFGPDRNLYVSSVFSSEVKRYGGTTGVFVDTFASGGGLSGPIGLVFGPDGNLYVSSNGTADVKRYHGTTGAFLDTFAAGGGLSGPNGLVFGPDGNLYVSSESTHNVKRYHGTTGAFMDTFASGGGLSVPRGLVFGPDGNLYVSSAASDEVKRYHGTTGAFMGNFAAGGDLALPYGLLFGPDGNLYVSSLNSDQVRRYNGATGAFMDTFASGGGLSGPSFLIFTPSAPVITCAKVDTTNGCAHTRTITYTAVDFCNNSNICTQVITWTEDTTPPDLTCASNKTVECGSVWDFDPPTALDSCSGTNVTITVLDTLTNGVCPVVITRTWRAADAAGNLRTCTQTVTLSPCLPPPAGLVGWWPGNGNANDLVGANHGLLNGGVSFTPGMVGAAFNFTVGGQYVEVPDAPALDITSGITLDAWINPSVEGGNRAILYKCTAGTPDGYSFDLFQGRLRLLVGNAGVLGVGSYFTSTQIIPANQWTHVAATYDGAVIRLYLNGTVDHALAVVEPFPVNAQPLRIGNASNLGAQFLGAIDEVGLYNRALTGAEINSLYAIGSAGKCASPLFAGSTTKTVSCATPWSFDLPQLINPCADLDPNPTILSTVTNDMVPPVITRTWGYTNVCGLGSATFSQAVTVELPGPVVLIVALTPNLDVQLSFPTVNTIIYVVEYKDNLTDPSWSTLTTVVGNGTLAEVVEPRPLLVNRFYRLHQLCP